MPNVAGGYHTGQCISRQSCVKAGETEVKVLSSPVIKLDEETITKQRTEWMYSWCYAQDAMEAELFLPEGFREKR